LNLRWAARIECLLAGAVSPRSADASQSHSTAAAAVARGSGE
jgi:hypothetical protein